MRYALFMLVLVAVFAAVLGSMGKPAVGAHAQCLAQQREARINAAMSGEDPREAISRTVPCGRGPLTD